MIESRDVASNHRESGEKACGLATMWGQLKKTHRVQNSTFESSQLTNHPSRFDVYQANDEIVACRREKPVVPLKVKLSDRGRQLHLVQKLCGVEVEELS